MAVGGKNNNRKEKPLLLVSSLDWGLGHTTRTIPVIKELLSLGCEIVIACNSTQKNVYQREFPTLRYEDLPGYNVNYAAGGWLTRLRIALQGVKILTQIKRENRWLTDFLDRNNISALISDNRYGLSHENVKSVFITHQLAPRTGLGTLLNKGLQYFLYKYLNRFSECWVPDFDGKSNLAGDLSHPASIPVVPVHYLGALSRFEKCDHSDESAFELLVVLSGPEPARTIFETLVLKQLKSSTYNVAIVRGLPESSLPLERPTPNCEIFNFLDSQQLNKLALSAKLVICRAGYTSVMDMIKLQKRMIVVPTPGQAEQEYLGKHLHQQKLAMNVPQRSFVLQDAVAAATCFSFKQIALDMNAYKNVLRDFVARISS